MRLKHPCLGVYERQPDGRLALTPHPIVPPLAVVQMNCIRMLVGSRTGYEYLLTWHLGSQFGGATLYISLDGTICTTLEEVP